MRKPSHAAPSARRLLPLAIAAPLFFLGLAPGPKPTATDPVPVHIAGIHVVDADQVLLLLADEKEQRVVPIAVGRDQGLAIYLGREKTATPRPMTHDLLVRILKTLKATVERITVTELRQETYISEIALRDGRTLHRIDARPSDAIALAVRLDTPIYAAPGLLRSLGEAAPPGLDARLDHRLGLTVQSLDADLAESLGASGVAGVLVASVAAGGAAEKAGLKRGDIIREVDGRPTVDPDAYGAAVERADGARQLSVWRDGRNLTLALR